MSFDSDQIEHRLATVEAGLFEIQQKLGMPQPSDWVERASGSLADMSEDDYQAFLECCRAVRNGEPIPEAEAPPP